MKSYAQSAGSISHSAPVLNMGKEQQHQKRQPTILQSFYVSSAQALPALGGAATASTKRKVTAISGQSSAHDVVCPVCNKRMRADVCMNNLHIDSCLEIRTRVAVTENSLNAAEIVVLDDADKMENDDAAAAAAAAAADISETDSKPYLDTAVLRGKPSATTKQVQTRAQPTPEAVKTESFAGRAIVDNNNWEPVPNVPGLYIMRNFITEEEEIFLESHLENNDVHTWKPSSFNGHCLTKYWCSPRQNSCGSSSSSGSAPRVIRPRVIQKSMSSSTVDTIVKEIDHMNEIPAYMQPIIDRFRTFLASKSSELPLELQQFNPNECNANFYSRARNDYLRPHFDDRARSGPALVNISLCGDCKMTFKIPPARAPSSSGGNGGGGPGGAGGSGDHKSSSSSSGGRSSGGNGSSGNYGVMSGGLTNAGDNATTSVHQPVSVYLPRRSLLFVSKKARYDYTHEIKAAHILSEKRISVTWRQSQVTWKQIAEERLQQQQQQQQQIWNK